MLRISPLYKIYKININKVGKRYNYVYKITNLINNNIYIGVHSSNKKKNKYMGSGTNIKNAIKREGLCNFKKEILYYYDSLDEAYAKESEIVNEEFISRNDTYNIILGGNRFLTANTITVKDCNGNCQRVSKDDPRYLNGELVPYFKDKIVVKDSEGNKLLVDKGDPRYLNGELVGHNKGKVVVKDSSGNNLMVDKDDPKYLSGELKHNFQLSNIGKVNVRDDFGNTFKVDKDDPRYLSGELKHVNSGKIWVHDNKGNRYRVFKDDPRYLSGELISKKYPIPSKQD